MKINLNAINPLYWIDNLIDWISLISENAELLKAKKEADYRHKADGRRYWVLPLSDGKFKVVNKYNIAESNRLLEKANRIDFKKLVENAPYRTK
jgi:hypothetical protein